MVVLGDLTRKLDWAERDKRALDSAVDGVAELGRNVRQKGLVLAWIEMDRKIYCDMPVSVGMRRGLCRVGSIRWGLRCIERKIFGIKLLIYEDVRGIICSSYGSGS